MYYYRQFGYYNLYCSLIKEYWLSYIYTGYTYIYWSQKLIAAMNAVNKKEFDI